MRERESDLKLRSWASKTNKMFWFEFFEFRKTLRTVFFLLFLFYWELYDSRLAEGFEEGFVLAVLHWACCWSCCRLVAAQIGILQFRLNGKFCEQLFISSLISKFDFKIWGLFSGTLILECDWTPARCSPIIERYQKSDEKMRRKNYYS